MDTVTQDNGHEVGFFPAEKNYQTRADKEIKILAMEIVRGHIYGSWMIRESMRIELVFMFLNFLDEIHQKALMRDNIVHFYTPIAEAGPMVINGCPTFFGGHPIDEVDFGRLMEKVTKMQEAMESI